MEPVVVIPAIKKNVAFPDDLVKTLAGITLVQRVINVAIDAFSREQTYVITDSEEIALICRRNRIDYVYDKEFILNPEAHLESLYPLVQPVACKWSDVIVLSPYAPLLTASQLRDAYDFYVRYGGEVLVPVTKITARFYSIWERSLAELLHDGGEQGLVCESHAFVVLNADLFEGEPEKKVIPLAYPIKGNLYEIHTYEDWWICEKLLTRKRIVFNVVGNQSVGMGHIFRCLALAHEISDHEIRFVCDIESRVAASKLAGYDYWLGEYEPEKLIDGIIELKPNLLINDVLNTDADDVRRCRDAGISVLNFEDFGSGVAEADLVINDLFDEPQIPGDNILWGHEWFFVRDEFNAAGQHKFNLKVERVLLAFGGTDPTGLTQSILGVIAPYCADNGIAIDVVTGDGYLHKGVLERLISELKDVEISYTHATGVISHIMENTEIAICSNGRTVYELAHMNVPSIVLSHHERESTHRFACQENGFVPLGIYEGAESNEAVLESLKRLVEDTEYRKLLFDNQANCHFTENKHKVIQLMNELLNNGGGVSNAR